MTDPWLYGANPDLPEHRAADLAGRLEAELRTQRAMADAMRRGDDQGAETAAIAMYRRAYLGHGDQLGALEAEAYAHSRARPGGARARLRRALAALLGSSP